MSLLIHESGSHIGAKNVSRGRETKRMHGQTRVIGESSARLDVSEGNSLGACVMLLLDRESEDRLPDHLHAGILFAREWLAGGSKQDS